MQYVSNAHRPKCQILNCQTPSKRRADGRTRLFVLRYVRPSLRLKTHGVENRPPISTPKTDMAVKDDDDAVAAAVMHLYSCKS